MVSCCLRRRKLYEWVVCRRCAEWGKESEDVEGWVVCRVPGGRPRLRGRGELLNCCLGEIEKLEGVGEDGAR